MRKLIVGLTFAVIATATCVYSIGLRAEVVKNHGYAVLGDACGRPNAVGAGTPIVKRHAEMVCISNKDGQLVWSPMPRRNALCSTPNQVWGRFRCDGSTWSSDLPTFSGTLDDAEVALRNAVAWTYESDVSRIGAPSREGYAVQLFNHSVVERELSERLATGGVEVAVYKDSVYLVARGGVEKCVRFADPWPSTYDGVKSIRLDAVVSVGCPTDGEVSAATFTQMKILVLNAVDAWRAAREPTRQIDQSTYREAFSELERILEDLMATDEWDSLSGISYVQGFPRSNNNVQLKIDRGCYQYTNDAGVGKIVETFCE